MQLTFGQKWHSNSDLTRSGSRHSAFQSALVLAPGILHYVCQTPICDLYHVLGNMPVFNCMNRLVPNRMAHGAEIYDLIMSCKCSEIKFKVDKDDDWII